MPHIETLYRRFKDSKDVQVVTFNIDENVGLLAPFLKENKYTFPVVPAQSLVESLGAFGVPRNWIVDAAGVMRFESVGFGGDAEKWMEQLLAMLEKVRAAR